MASRAQRLNQLSSMYANKKRSGWSDTDIKKYFSRTQKGRLKNDITWGQIASNRKRQVDRRSDFNEATSKDPTINAFAPPPPDSSKATTVISIDDKPILKADDGAAKKIEQAYNEMLKSSQAPQSPSPSPKYKEVPKATGTYTKYEVPKGLEGVSYKLQKSSESLLLQGTVLGGFGAFGVSAAKGAIDTIIFGKNLITNPVGTTKGVYGAAKGVVMDPMGSLFKVGQAFKTRAPQVVGELTGSTAVTAGAGAVASKAGSLLKSGYMTVGTPYIDRAKVFATEGKITSTGMPLTSSTKDSLKRFAAADNWVSTASPAKISGKTAGVGKKAADLFEDSGIFVTPKGEGSAYFTRLTKDIAPEYKISFNPFKGAKDIPSVTNFKTSGVIKQPRSVVNQPGFKGVQDFLETTGKKQTGKAYITKRSEVGLGEVKRSKLKESGTSEIEAVIPPGQKFKYTPKTIMGKIKGFDAYTKVNGKPVAIRDASLLGSTKIPKGKISVSPLKKSKVIGGKQIARETSALSSLGRRTVYVNPSKAVPILSRGVKASKSVSSKGSSILSSTISSRGSSASSSAPSLSSVISSSKGKPSSSPISSSKGSSSSKISISRGGSSGGGSSGGSSSGISISGGSSSGGSYGFTNIPPPPPPLKPPKWRQDITNTGQSKPLKLLSREYKYTASLVGYETKSKRKKGALTGLEVRGL